MIQLSPEIQINLRHLEEIYTSLRKNDITLSKTEASKIVGSRYMLEKLVATKKIRVKEQSAARFNRWACLAEDVLRYANYKEKIKS